MTALFTPDEWRYLGHCACLVPFGIASGVAATLLSRRWDAPTALAVVVALALVYVACRRYDWLSDRLAALRWWWRWWGHRRAVRAQWRVARRQWWAPWEAEPWAAYAHLARLEAQAQTRKERIA